MKKVFACLLFLLLINIANAQEKLYDEFKNTFSKEYLEIGALIKFLGEHQIERTSGTNGFILGNLRLKLTGEFDDGIGYFIQTEFTKSPSILDARISYNLLKSFSVDAGLFKSPFSREFLTSNSNLDFVERAQLTELAPNRQIGVMLRGKLAGDFVSYFAGVFNGNRFNTSGNDNNDMLYAARVTLTPKINKMKNLEVGVNAAVSRDSKVKLFGSNFNGKRFVYGGDIRFTPGNFLLNAEAAAGQFESGGVTIKPLGYQATFGYCVAAKHQLLVRWDSFKIDSAAEPVNLIILGYNVWPTKISKFQVNYIIDTDDSAFKHNRLMINAQVAL